MESESGHTRSLWLDTADVPDFPKLTRNARADVCVVGAGIAGLSTAYLLTKAGKKVVVVDDGPIGGGETLALRRPDDAWTITTTWRKSALEEGRRLHARVMAQR